MTDRLDNDLLPEALERRRTGLWADQGDGTSLRRTSAIIDGCTADVLAPETELEAGA